MFVVYLAESRLLDLSGIWRSACFVCSSWSSIWAAGRRQLRQINHTASSAWLVVAADLDRLPCLARLRFCISKQGRFWRWSGLGVSRLSLRVAYLVTVHHPALSSPIVASKIGVNGAGFMDLDIVGWKRSIHGMTAKSRETLTMEIGRAHV